jgi:hypothetical protein
VRFDDSVTCWGDGWVGAVVPPALTSALQVSTHFEDNCALRPDGRLGCWGDRWFNGGGPSLFTPDLPPTAVQVELGGYFICVLNVSGTVTCADDGHIWPTGPRYPPPAVPLGLNLLGPQTQSVAFTTAAPDPGIVDEKYTVAATGGASGVAVWFTSKTPETCTVNGIAPQRVRFVAPGRCVVAADQDGIGDYAPAPQATQSIRVMGTQSIRFVTSPPAPATAGAIYAVVVTGGASGKAVVLRSDTPAVCAVGSGKVVLISAGLCRITASQAGDDRYLPAPEKSQFFKVD